MTSPADTDASLTDPLTAGSPGPDSSPWDEAQTLQMTRALPESPPEPRKSVSSEALPTIGHIGRYALKYRIGEGGLGVVYAAHDPLLSRLIAVKTLNVDIQADARDTFNQLFLNEAKAAGSLSHPHIVTVFDAGLHEDEGQQGAYIAMELLKGKDLRQLLKDGWRPTPAQAALIVRRVADALAYAHTRGVVHCDIKPANIFMVGRTQPRVLDFGIARIARRRDAASRGDTTQHDETADLVAGSPYYMAPEQVRNESVDRRADVYSLGVVLYELLTGHRPFDGETLSAITDAVLHRKPPSAHQIVPEVPKELSEIAERAMMRNREHRTHSARALSRELRHWLEQQTPEAFEERKSGRLPWRRLLTWAGGIAGVLAITGGMVWWGATHPMPPEQAAQQPVAEAPPPPVVAPAPAPVAQPASTAVLEDAASQAVSQADAALAEQAAASAEAPAPTPTLAPAQARGAAEGSTEPAAKPSPAAQLPAGTSTTMSTAAELRARERAELRKAVRAAAKASAAGKPAVVGTGSLVLAVTPWAQVEVDGTPAGTSPPLNRLNLSEGRHTVVLRNDAFPAHTLSINVSAGETTTIRHRFGP